jgi:hypothetical protein
MGEIQINQYINKQQNITGILWQGRFFSSPLDEQYTYYGFAKGTLPFFRSPPFFKTQIPAHLVA